MSRSRSRSKSRPAARVLPALVAAVVGTLVAIGAADFPSPSIPHSASAFATGSGTTTLRHPHRTTALSAARYGPRDAPPPPLGDATPDDAVAAVAASLGEDASELRRLIKSEFCDLLDEVLKTGENTPEGLPSLLTRSMETVFTVMSIEGLIEEAVADYVDARSGDDDDDDDRDETLRRASSAVNVLLSFAEEFVDQTKSVEDSYKKLMGRIFKAIAPAAAGGGGDGKDDDEDPVFASSLAAGGGTSTEARLDSLLSREKEAFTAGFLRHVEGECDRIASQPTISPETTRMLQILRVIQARVLEELGKEIGEGAVVLGQLLGYDDRSERLAVLEAGLTVRGADFAKELYELTAEALEGFRNVPDGDVDPVLIERVKEIDGRIRRFANEEAEKRRRR